MKHLQKIAYKYRGLMIVYILVGMIWTFTQGFSALYFQRVIDHFADNSLTLTEIIVYGLMMVTVYLLCYVQNYPERKLEHGIGLSLKILALRKMSVLDYRAYARMGTGVLIQRIESGAAAGSGILFGFYLRMAGELVPQMLFSVLFIFMIHRTVMVAILVGYVAVFLVSNLLLRALYGVKAGILVNEERLNHVLVRGFMEMVVFRVNRRFGAELRKAESAADEIVRSKVKMKLIHEAFFAIFVILVALLKIGMLAYGWMTKSMSIGEIVALIALVDNAFMPIAIFNVCYVQYKLDKVAFLRYAEFLDAEEDVQLSVGEEIAELDGSISFSGLRYRYDDREIFDGLDLEIAAGEMVAFVGESGSGKSTAVKLAVGLLHPDAGVIRVGGRPLQSICLNSYYAFVAYLPQDPPIFDGSLRENIVFDDLVEDAVLREVLERVSLNSLFAKLEKGFETPLGERGISLSGGERQQLALARLWFSKARLIVLDEATSAMDNLTEAAVMQNVMEQLRGRTVLTIAHRLDSVRNYDRIVVFKEGRVVAQGAFETLLQDCRYFADLYYRSQEESSCINSI